MKTLYEDRDVCFELLDNKGTYRVTFFENSHWAGDISFNKQEVINNDLGEA